MAWNRPTSNTGNATSSSRLAGRGKMPRLRRGLIAGAIVVLGAGLAAWLFIGGEADSRPLQKKDRGRIKEVAPAPTPTAKPKEPPKEEKKEDVWLGSKVVRRVATTNGVNIAEQIFTADGRKHWRFSDTAKPVFDNAADQIIAMVLSDKGNGAPLPALGSHFEDEFGEAIKKEIVINDDDSDAVKAIKQSVIDARKQILEQMAAGVKADDVLVEHHRAAEFIANARMDAVKGLREFVDAGDMDGARLYVEKVNPVLRSMGVMELGAPMTREEQHEERVKQYQEMKNKENQK